MTSHTQWSAWHHRLHQRLLKNPQLLPSGSSLVLAVSGGQDSMALLRLLHDLSQQHAWTIRLWHGDHGWHQHSSENAAQLSDWCNGRGLELQISRAERAHAHTEARARSWRYSELKEAAERWGGDVVNPGDTPFSLMSPPQFAHVRMRMRSWPGSRDIRSDLPRRTLIPRRISCPLMPRRT